MSKVSVPTSLPLSAISSMFFTESISIAKGVCWFIRRCLARLSNWLAIIEAADSCDAKNRFVTAGAQVIHPPPRFLVKSSSLWSVPTLRTSILSIDCPSGPTASAIAGRTGLLAQIPPSMNDHSATSSSIECSSKYDGAEAEAIAASAAKRSLNAVRSGL